MGFQDLDDYLDPTLRLPVNGKVYVVHSPDSKTGLWANNLMAAARAARAGDDVDTTGLELDDDEERDLFKRLLGATYDELLAEVDWVKLKHVGITTLMWVTGGRQQAEAFWVTGGDNPKAPPATPGEEATPTSTTPAAPPASPASSTPPDPEPTE